jgi:uncharacterized membrane protein
MPLILPIHIASASVALLTGFIALYVAKGGTLHRRTGVVYVGAMLLMATCGILVAVTRGKAPAVNIPVALITMYLVFTGFTAVRPIAFGQRWLPQALMLLAAGIGTTDLVFAAQAITHGGRRQGIPTAAFLVFGIVALLASWLDLKALRAGALRGAPRLARHLWRMSAALLIATLSFVSRPRLFPAPLRHGPILVLPIVAVFLTMIYWLWRVRTKRARRFVAPDRIGARPSRTAAVPLGVTGRA